MKFPRIKVQDKQAFEKRLSFWIFLRDAIGEGSWLKLAAYLGADKYTHGPKRIRKKRMRRYMLSLVMGDLMEAGNCQKL